jgi:hypothetical protein
VTRLPRRARARTVALAVAWSASIAVALVFAAPAAAHDFSPGVLALVEYAPGRFGVAWTEPVDSQGAPAGVRVTFPPQCRLEGQQLDCGAAGLHGPIAFEGMHTARMQVVLSIRARDGSTEEQVVTGSSPQTVIGARPTSSALTWGRLGVEHIVGGIDHLAFVLGLLLLLGHAATGGEARAASARWSGIEPRALIATITAFTIAHSVTLALATLGVLRVSSAPVEATIAASVLLVAREAMHDEPTWTRRAPWAVAMLFGLVHGLGFAGALRELGLPSGSVGWALLWFNVGVELGQLAVVAVALLAVRLTRRWLSEWRWARAAACYALGAMAAYWFIARTVLLSRGG